MLFFFEVLSLNMTSEDFVEKNNLYFHIFFHVNFAPLLSVNNEQIDQIHHLFTYFFLGGGDT